MKYVKIPKKDFIREHNRLIRILKSGNSKALKSEYKEQSKELKNYLRGKK